MAQVCDICGKGPQFGNNISHAHNVTRRRWNVNLQAVKALVNGAPKRIRVCTSCIKSGKITKHSAAPKSAALRSQLKQQHQHKSPSRRGRAFVVSALPPPPSGLLFRKRQRS